jgi:hypothetical protein
MPDFVLLKIEIVEVVVDIDGLRLVVDIFIVMADGFGVVVGALIVFAILLFSTWGKTSGCG